MKHLILTALAAVLVVPAVAQIYSHEDSRGSSLERLAYRAERQSNSFRAWFERSYNRKLGQGGRGLKSEIQHMDEAMERVRRHPDRAHDDVEDAMDHARRIDRELIETSGRDIRQIVPEWLDLRVTMDRLAQAYHVRRI